MADLSISRKITIEYIICNIYTDKNFWVNCGSKKATEMFFCAVYYSSFDLASYIWKGAKDHGFVVYFDHEFNQSMIHFVLENDKHRGNWLVNFAISNKINLDNNADEHLDRVFNELYAKNIDVEYLQWYWECYSKLGINIDLYGLMNDLMHIAQQKSDTKMIAWLMSKGMKCSTD